MTHTPGRVDGRIIVIIALLLMVLAAGCGTPLQKSVQAGYAAKQTVENLYVSVRRLSWKLPQAEGAPLRAEARGLIEEYYAAQQAWYTELANARAEGDTGLDAVGRSERINACAARVTAVGVKLRLLYEKHKED